jgi:ABC-type nitrate/sulfonate/bicarbonate transport system permease component
VDDVAVAAASRPAPAFTRVLRSTRTARLLFPLAVLAIWQLGFMMMETYILPSPAETLNFMWDEIRLETLSRHTLYQSFAISLGRLAIGFSFALVIGTVIGLLMGLFKPVEWFLYDTVVVVLAIPSLVWGLMTGLMFGFGNLAPIVTVMAVGIPFVILNVLEGVKNTPKELFDMSKSFKVPRSRTVRHVLIPSLMPFLFAALRYGFANGWKGLVLAEVFASSNGAGWTIRYWYDAHRGQGVLGYALFFILFALFIERGVFERISKRVFRWRPSAADTPVVEEAAPAAKRFEVSARKAEAEESDRGRV